MPRYIPPSAASASSLRPTGPKFATRLLPTSPEASRSPLARSRLRPVATASPQLMPAVEGAAGAASNRLLDPRALPGGKPFLPPTAGVGFPSGDANARAQIPGMVGGLLRSTPPLIKRPGRSDLTTWQSVQRPFTRWPLTAAPFSHAGGLQRGRDSDSLKASLNKPIAEVLDTLYPSTISRAPGGGLRRGLLGPGFGNHPQNSSLAPASPRLDVEAINRAALTSNLDNKVEPALLFIMVDAARENARSFPHPAPNDFSLWQRAWAAREARSSVETAAPPSPQLTSAIFRLAAGEPFGQSDNQVLARALNIVALGQTLDAIADTFPGSVAGISLGSTPASEEQRGDPYEIDLPLFALIAQEASDGDASIPEVFDRAWTARQEFPPDARVPSREYVASIVEAVRSHGEDISAAALLNVAKANLLYRLLGGSSPEGGGQFVEKALRDSILAWAATHRPPKWDWILDQIASPDEIQRRGGTTFGTDGTKPEALAMLRKALDGAANEAWEAAIEERAVRWDLPWPPAPLPDRALVKSLIAAAWTYPNRTYGGDLELIALAQLGRYTPEMPEGLGKIQQGIVAETTIGIGIALGALGLFAAAGAVVVLYICLSNGCEHILRGISDFFRGLGDDEEPLPPPTRSAQPKPKPAPKPPKPEPKPEPERDGEYGPEPQRRPPGTTPPGALQPAPVMGLDPPWLRSGVPTFQPDRGQPWNRSPFLVQPGIVKPEGGRPGNSPSDHQERFKPSVVAPPVKLSPASDIEFMQHLCNLNIGLRANYGLSALELVMVMLRENPLLDPATSTATTDKATGKRIISEDTAMGLIQLTIATLRGLARDGFYYMTTEELFEFFTQLSRAEQMEWVREYYRRALAGISPGLLNGFSETQRAAYLYYRNSGGFKTNSDFNAAGRFPSDWQVWSSTRNNDPNRRLADCRKPIILSPEGNQHWAETHKWVTLDDLLCAVERARQTRLFAEIKIALAGC